jgi:TolA-binding protein
LAPIALANGAAAWEEATDGENATRLWSRIVEEYGAEAAESARALFALGRIAEGEGAFEDAAVRYNTLLDDYPASSWTNLARNRIIYLTTEGLIGS